MTTTEQYTIHNVIQMIESGEIKIPIFQRRYVWSKEQVEKLFTTVFNDNPFGAISAIKTTDDYPIYASRTFFEDLKDKFQLAYLNDGQNHDKDNPLYLILDGQQRLQSFYLGLTSKFDGMELYFNKYNGSFHFFSICTQKEYISVKKLYFLLRNKGQVCDYGSVAKSFNAEEKAIVNQNIFKFYYQVFFQQRIVMLLAYPIGIEEDDKIKFFELFKRLNTSGVNLDIYDLCVSKLKALNPLWEDIFIKIEKEFGNIDYYPYDVPFTNNIIRRNVENKSCNFSSYLKKSKIFITTIYYCLNKIKLDNSLDIESITDKYTNYLNSTDFRRIVEDSIESIATHLKNDNDINSLFEFIHIVFDLCRIINIPTPVLARLVGQLYSLYTNKQEDFNVQKIIINYYISRFKSQFVNQKSLELFVYKYYLMNDLDDIANSNAHTFWFKSKGDYYEIQIGNKPTGCVHQKTVNIHNKLSRRYKFADEIVEKELEKTKTAFFEKWEERAQKSAEWKTLNDNYIKNK